MTISTNGTGIRPGVVTSTTRPSSPYEGMMIFETDTNRVLIWDNAAWVMIADTDTPPGLQHIKTVTISSSTPYVEILDCFSSEFGNYRIVTNNVICDQQTTWGFYLGTNNSSGAYYGSNYIDLYTGGNTATQRMNASNFAYLALSDTNANASAASIDLLSPNLGVYKHWHGTSTGRTYSGWTAGLIQLTTQFTGIRFVNNTGNITSGTFRVYGYRN